MADTNGDRDNSSIDKLLPAIVGWNGPQFLTIQPIDQIDILNDPKVFNGNIAYLKFQDGEIIGPEEAIQAGPICMLIKSDGAAGSTIFGESTIESEVMKYAAFTVESSTGASQFGDKKPFARIRFTIPLRLFSKKITDRVNDLPRTMFEIRCDSAIDHNTITLRELKDAFGTYINISFVKY